MKKRIVLITLGIVVILIITALLAAEYYTSRPSFCGSCHIMKKYYDTWKKSKHGEKEVACVDCHYTRGERHAVRSRFRGLGQIFTYLGTGGTEVRKVSKVSDFGCTASECHPEQKANDKNFIFMKNIPFVHKTHFDRLIEGQELHCNTCHQNLRAKDHFKVTKEACYLCHFKEVKFNQDRAKCSLCHKIPEKPLQSHKTGDAGPAEKPITHKSLERAGVPCRSCHYELIQGKGEIREEDCFDCHEYSDEMLKLREDKKIMHEKHIAEQNARCFDCHEPIQHKKIEFLDPVRETCFACHPDHHKYQLMLLLGYKWVDTTKTPGLMYDVKTNCIGCHVDERIQKGEKVLHGSDKACAACHTEKYRFMVEQWKNKTKKELESAGELEKKAAAAIDKARGKVSPETLGKALSMLSEGREFMNTVKYGGGVHNNRYSIMLLDLAMNNFEEIVNLLGE